MCTACSGYVRERGLTANQLLHIPGAGDFQIDRIEGPPALPPIVGSAAAARQPHAGTTGVIPDDQARVNSGTAEQSNVVLKVDNCGRRFLASQLHYNSQSLVAMGLAYGCDSRAVLALAQRQWTRLVGSARCWRRQTRSGGSHCNGRISRTLSPASRPGPPRRCRSSLEILKARLCIAITSRPGPCRMRSCSVGILQSVKLESISRCTAPIVPQPSDGKALSQHDRDCFDTH